KGKMAYDEFGNPISSVRNNEGSFGPGNKNKGSGRNNQIAYDENGKPITGGSSLEHDEYGNPISEKNYDEFGNIIPKETILENNNNNYNNNNYNNNEGQNQSNKDIFANEDYGNQGMSGDNTQSNFGNCLYDEFGRPIKNSNRKGNNNPYEDPNAEDEERKVDEYGNPLRSGKNKKRGPNKGNNPNNVEYDEEGNPIEYGDYGNEMGEEYKNEGALPRQRNVGNSTKEFPLANSVYPEKCPNCGSPLEKSKNNSGDKTPSMNCPKCNSDLIKCPRCEKPIGNLINFSNPIVKCPNCRLELITCPNCSYPLYAPPTKDNPENKRLKCKCPNCKYNIMKCHNCGFPFGINPNSNQSICKCPNCDHEMKNPQIINLQDRDRDGLNNRNYPQGNKGLYGKNKGLSNSSSNNNMRPISGKNKGQLANSNSMDVFRLGLWNNSKNNGGTIELPNYNSHCFACDVGCSIGRSGYSPMTFSPYGNKRRRQDTTPLYTVG
ncbi:MAG: hypothetical protein MJ252_15630, partial [archaeon]|nr:hypothetical protein [archaeon]